MDEFALFRNITIIFATLMLFKYVLFMLIAPFYPVKELLRRKKLLKEQESWPKYAPLVSVVIPAWNEAVGIIKSVSSAMANSYGNIEVIVVNDGSTDETENRVMEYIKKHKDKFTKTKYVSYYYKANSGKGATLNYGIRKAKGDIILTMDADSALAKNAIVNLIEYFKDNSISGVVGNVKIGENYTFIGLMQRLEYLFGFYFKRTHSVVGSEYIFGGACAAFRASVFKDIGEYDEVNKTEDIEMTMRLKAHGLKSAYAEDVICFTEGAGNLSGLINQRLRWKKGRLDTFMRYRSLFFSTNKNHNKFMSWFVLPYALLQEIQLFFEPIAFSLLFAYSFISGDYTSLMFGLLFILIIYVVVSFDNQEGFKPEVILTFPATWFMFYFLVWIEFLALMKSIYMIFRNETITWQKWNRKGIYEMS